MTQPLYHIYVGIHCPPDEDEGDLPWAPGEMWWVLLDRCPRNREHAMQHIKSERDRGRLLDVKVRLRRVAAPCH